MEITVSGARTFVKEWGEGPPVLMLHGNPDTHEVWEPVASRLASRFRCIAPDLPGFGDSHEPARYDASLTSQAKFVEGVLDALSIQEPVHLVVHDIGGPHGFAFTCEHPERVKKIAIANTLFHSTYRWHPWARVWRTPILGNVAMRLLDVSRALFVNQTRRGAPKLSVERANQMYDAITPRMKRATLRWYRAATPDTFGSWERKLAELVPQRIPAIVVWGEHDPYIPRSFADRFGANEVHRFETAGHWVIVEEPELVAQAIGTFFEK